MSFVLFARLPAELQLQIWELAVLDVLEDSREPQINFVSWKYRRGSPRKLATTDWHGETAGERKMTRDNDPHRWLSAYHRTMAFKHTCYDSRKVHARLASANGNPNGVYAPKNLLCLQLDDNPLPAGSPVAGKPWPTTFAIEVPSRWQRIEPQWFNRWDRVMATLALWANVLATTRHVYLLDFDIRPKEGVARPDGPRFRGNGATFYVVNCGIPQHRDAWEFPFPWRWLGLARGMFTAVEARIPAQARIELLACVLDKDDRQNHEHHIGYPAPPCRDFDVVWLVFVLVVIFATSAYALIFMLACKFVTGLIFEIASTIIRA